jgi:hypothetical protein
MNINLAPKPKSPAPRQHEIIDGFEVWRHGRTWNAQKWPQTMSASTKQAIVKMIRNR